MRNYVIGILLLIVLAAGAFFLLWRPDTQPQQVNYPVSPEQTESDQNAVDFPEPQPGAIVFDMKYRGLSGEKDELRYNSYWGFGGNEKDTPFLKALKKKVVEGLHAVYNPHFCEARKWSALEVKDGKVVAFYFDLNADGKVAENEKILPIPAEKSNTSASNRWDFVTPDFVLNKDKDRPVPFRALLQASIYGDSSRPHGMWSPSCVLEGTATVAGKPTKLILYANGFSVSFTEYGGCSYSLLATDEKPGRYVSRHTLSSLVNYNGQYYRLHLNGDHVKGTRVRAVLDEYTGDTGQIALNLIGNSGLKAELSSASLAGTKDDTIRFNISGGQSVLPAEAYKLRSAYINYGTGTEEQCRVNVTDGPEFEIEANTTCKVKLGNPVLAVRAIDEKKRYQSDAKEQSVFSEGTSIFLTSKIVGKAGELYGRFSRRGDKSGRYEDVEPTIRIVDSGGKEVASATMEYG